MFNYAGVRQHDAVINGGENREWRRGRCRQQDKDDACAMWSRSFGLALVEVNQCRGSCKQFGGEADDVGQWRAQLIGNVLARKSFFSASAFAQCLGLFGPASCFGADVCRAADG